MDGERLSMIVRVYGGSPPDSLGATAAALAAEVTALRAKGDALALASSTLLDKAYYDWEDAEFEAYGDAIAVYRAARKEVT